MNHYLFIYSIFSGFLLFGCKNNNNLYEKYNHSKDKKITCIDINDSIKIRFLKESNGDLFTSPTILKQGKYFEIENFDGETSLDYKVSPNNKYIVLDRIDDGLVYPNKEYHEKTGCVIIDIYNHKIIDYLTEDCDGKWTTKNEWINWDNKVIFEGK